MLSSLILLNMNTLQILLFLITLTFACSSVNAIDGPCDAELCACIVSPVTSLDEKCPEWMDIYTIQASSPCVINGGEGQVFCFGRNEAGDGPSTSCAFLGDVEPSFFTEINITQGVNGTLLYQYNETNPAPECPLDPPFTLMPSAAPTVTPMPTLTSAAKNNATFSSVLSTALVFMYTMMAIFI